MATRPTGKPSSRSAPATTQGVQHAIVALDSLTPHPRNYRAHPEAQLARLGASLARFGQVRSIVCQEGADGRYLIVAGHGLAEAARANGYTELHADIIPPTWTPQQVEGYLIADNESSRAADDDLTQLAAMLEEQRAAGEALESLGFDDAELAALLDDLANAALAGGDGRDVDDPDGGGDDFDTTPDESGPTRCQSGDLWQLGQHRLLCGDSTKREDVARLMAGETADACITDPPYGIDWNTDYTRFTGPNRKARKKVASDDTPFDPSPLLDYPIVVLWGANCFLDRLEPGSMLVWDKRYASGTAWLADAEIAWMKGGMGVYILSVTSQGATFPEKREHATQKPVAVMAWCIEKSKADGIIFEPYLGSGTTLIACERTGRRCYGLEIDPRYCDVILRRWEAETGREATLLERATPAERTTEEPAHVTASAHHQ